MNLDKRMRRLEKSVALPWVVRVAAIGAAGR